MRTYPRDPQPHIGLSNYYQSAGQYGKAAAEAEKAIGIDPDFSSGYDSLALNDIYLDRLGNAGKPYGERLRAGWKSMSLPCSATGSPFSMVTRREWNELPHGLAKSPARRTGSTADRRLPWPTRVACARRGTCPNSRRNRLPWQDNAGGRDCGKPERPCARPFSGTMLRPPKGDRRH